ncbi:MAG: UDP-N-acetylglucosamine 2-epimerase (non-hydrolyzing) [Deltaproteobacteria bacterium]|nr:UDP-N-acetylglucosamine 2-epimerase (non-hydrolyzing) [Deltaproteobacteria bacterium]
MHIFHVVGARPNFMKAAPVVRALACSDFLRQTLVHTGQHYDVNMSEVFFRELGLPAPDVNLEVGSGSHAQQTAEIMSRFEPVVLEHKPDLVLVYGDVNSTVAAALVCAKLLVPVGHVEAGLRSFDRTMPEEINRLLTDQISDLLFTPSIDGNENLLREGVAAEKMHLVGNVMIDTLIRLLPVAQEGTILTRLELQPYHYGLVTLHRPSNVDEPRMLASIMAALNDIGDDLPLVFPVHPRTRERLKTLEVRALSPCVRLIDPLSYLDFLALQRSATVVITDSGGIQEESTYLGVPCLTMRENTERPITITLGTSLLIGRDLTRLRDEVRRILEGKGKHGQIPPLWDGHTAKRIAEAIMNWGNLS